MYYRPGFCNKVCTPLDFAPKTCHHNSMENHNALAQDYLQLLPTTTLTAVLAGEVDLNHLAHRVMASRGLDAAGRWVGFDAAKALHGV
jgi:hypothetical protein